MLILFLRAVILFITTVILMRLMGKRQIAQLQPYELALSILIADLAAAPMGDTAIPLAYGVIPMLAMIFMHTLLTLCCMKNERLRRIIDGRAYPVIQDGALSNDALDKLGYSMSDLLEELRAAGFLRIQDVEQAIVETTGKLSVFPIAAKDTVRASDMGLTPKSGGFPLPLILSGHVQKENLPRFSVNEEWLNARLIKAGFASPREVALASMDATGTLLLYSISDTCKPVVVNTRKAQ